jgi:DNA-directed RNA polymerase specialized sigma24 family protein
MRLVVVLVDMAELDYRQAARALNLSTTDVKHRLALARQAITKMILAD